MSIYMYTYILLYVYFVAQLSIRFIRNLQNSNQRRIFLSYNIYIRL